jgi:ArsR family transcriptional regulator, virulence genes transcriptional regulator
MSNPVRIEVLKRVTENEWDVSALAADLDLSQSTLSQHLSKLREAKLVKTRRAAQKIFYSSRSPAVLAILATLENIGSLSLGQSSDGRASARHRNVRNT